MKKYRTDSAILDLRVSRNTQNLNTKSNELPSSFDLLADVGFPEGPVWTCKFTDRYLLVTRDDLDGNSFTAVVAAALPICTPVPGHGCPVHAVAFHVRFNHHTRPSHVRDGHQVEVAVPVQSKSDSSEFLARDSAPHKWTTQNEALADTE